MRGGEGEVELAGVSYFLGEIVTPFMQLNQIAQELLAQFQSAANQSTATQLIEITQQPVAQIGEVEQTLFAIYRTDIPQIEEYFKRSAIVRTNWASRIIDNTPKNN